MSALCPYCRQPLASESITLWDDRQYCQACVREVSPELLELALSGAALEDVIRREDVSGWRYFRALTVRVLALVVVVLYSPFAILVLLGRAPLFLLDDAFLVFGGAGMVAVTLTVLVGRARARSKVPRTISVANGELRVSYPNDVSQCRIRECAWYEGSVSADPLTAFTDLSRGVVVISPDNKFALGHSPNGPQYWRSFFVLTTIPSNPPLGCLPAVATLLLGLALGAAIGLGIGYIVSVLTNNPTWRLALAFVGSIEGPVIGFMYLNATREGRRAAHERYNPLLAAVAFFAAGIKIGLFSGVWGALLCGAANALIGLIVALTCRARIRAAAYDKQVFDFQLHEHSVARRS